MKKYEQLSEIRQELARRRGYCGLIATQESPKNALEYANSLINTLRGADQVAAMTALGVVVNTFAIEYANVEFTRDALRRAGFKEDVIVEIITNHIREELKG